MALLQLHKVSYHLIKLDAMLWLHYDTMSATNFTHAAVSAGMLGFMPWQQLHPLRCMRHRMPARRRMVMPVARSKRL